MAVSGKAIAAIVLFSQVKLKSQDIQQLQSSKFLEANGSVQAVNTFYHAQGKSNSRKPMGYLINGNLNITIKGIVQAPFGFVISNQGNKFTQPHFNQSAIHPKYKWIQAHAGILSNSWSHYTLNGHVYKGAGIDLTPGSIEFSACGGEFVSARRSGSLLDANQSPGYKRLGGGAKLGIRMAGKGEISANAFYAADDKTSIIIPLLSEITPQENLAVSIKGSTAIKKILTLRTDVGISWLNENLNSVLPVTLLSAGKYHAIKTAMDVKLGRQILNLGYERIEPGYRTLGAYYFNNDLENVTVGAVFSMLHNRLNLNTQFGKQRDNLLSHRLSDARRNVANLNANFIISKSWNVNASYSNFLSYSNLRSVSDYYNNLNPYMLWDTLNFRQISRNIQASVSGRIRSDSMVQSTLTISAVLQNSAEWRNEKLQQGSDFINITAGFQRVSVQKGKRLGVCLNASANTLSGQHNWMICPSLNGGGKLVKSKAQWTVACGFSSTAGAGFSSPVMNLRTNLLYKFNQLNSLTITGMWLQRNTYQQQAGFQEGSISLAWQAVLP